MAELSSGQRIALAGRVLGRRAGRNRIFAAVLRGLSAAGRSLSAVLLRLWHEIMGLMFLVFALAGSEAALREYQHYASGSSHGPGRFLLAAAFSLLFAWFGVSAFMRARQAGKTR